LNFELEPLVSLSYIPVEVTSEELVMASDAMSCELEKSLQLLLREFWETELY
jgi:hypothetical protein